jgi:hypothetical protein
MIEPLRRGERDYLAQFGVTAIYITCSCMLGVGRDLARVGPVAAAWWVASRREAEQVLVAIGERHPATVDEATRELLAAAARLDVVLSEHTVVLAPYPRLSGTTRQSHTDARRGGFGRFSFRADAVEPRTGRGRCQCCSKLSGQPSRGIPTIDCLQNAPAHGLRRSYRRFFVPGTLAGRRDIQTLINAHYAWIY